MTKLQARLVIMADEWLGVAFLGWLHYTKNEWFIPVLVFWVCAVYLISYPLYWNEYRERKTGKPGFGEENENHAGGTYWGDSVRRSSSAPQKTIRKFTIVRNENIDRRFGIVQGEAVEIRSSDALHGSDDPKTG